MIPVYLEICMYCWSIQVVFLVLPNQVVPHICLAHQTLAACAALHASAMTFNSFGINLFCIFLVYMLWVTCHALKAMYKLNLHRWPLFKLCSLFCIWFRFQSNWWTYMFNTDVLMYRFLALLVNWTLNFRDVWICIYIYKTDACLLFCSSITYATTLEVLLVYVSLNLLCNKCIFFSTTFFH